MCDNGSEFISKNLVDICKQNNIDIDYVSVNNHLISHVGNIDLVLLIGGYKHFGQKWRNTCQNMIQIYINVSKI